MTHNSPSESIETTSIQKYCKHGINLISTTVFWLGQCIIHTSMKEWCLHVSLINDALSPLCLRNPIFTCLRPGGVRECIERLEPIHIFRILYRLESGWKRKHLLDYSCTHDILYQWKMGWSTSFEVYWAEVSQRYI